jgi:IS5 family transposase
MYQNSFLAIAQQKKQLRCEKFLQEMNRIIPWDVFMKEIEPYYQAKEVGRKRKALLMMLRIYCLQQWYSLSDPAVEEAVYDRMSFQKFLGIDLLSEEIPDETTILNFRHLLEEHGLQEKFFIRVREILEKKELLMKEGTIADATLIAAPSSTKNESRKRDPEMSSTKKGKAWHFGMKAHIGVDRKRGLVHTVVCTTAKDHDRSVFADLVHGEERSIFGDKGYVSDEDKRTARASGIAWCVLDKGKRGHALSGKQKKRNHRYASIRAKVEHPFQVLKCQWGYVKVRYRGLRKNTAQLYTLFALVNLFKVRKLLLVSV